MENKTQHNAVKYHPVGLERVNENGVPGSFQSASYRKLCLLFTILNMLIMLSIGIISYTTNKGLESTISNIFAMLELNRTPDVLPNGMKYIGHVNKDSPVMIVTACIKDRTGSSGGYMTMTILNQQAYARRHGYSFLALCERIPSSKEDVRWQKEEFAEYVYENYEFEWLFYTDCDALFMEFSQPLSKFFPEDAQIMFVYAGDRHYVLNSGQYLLRRSDLGKKLLNTMNDRSNHERPSDWCEKHWKDNALFVKTLFRDCENSAADVWTDPTKCPAHAKHAVEPYSGHIYCDLRISTYPGVWRNAGATSVLHGDSDWHWKWFASTDIDGNSPFRVHMAGGQAGKIPITRAMLSRILGLTR